MPLTLDDIKAARDWGVLYHQTWKRQIKINDAVAANEWEVVWDDDTIDASEPLVENVYLGSVEDKVSVAASAIPSIFALPPPGTREDRGERQAQRRKRVYQSYWDRSDMPRLLRRLYMDWFHTGAGFVIPWTEWWDVDGVPRAAAERAPYAMKLDPRQAYPLAHDNRGRLIKAIFARQRRVAELKAEYGPTNPAFTEMKARRQRRGLDEADYLEEVWYFDNWYWAVAVGDSMLPREWQGRQIMPNGLVDNLGGTELEWLAEPTKHGLGRCPVAEVRRDTHDGSYRGAVEDVIPSLKVAQNFMARLLDDMGQNIYAPVVLDNIENADEYGPGAILRGTGDGSAAIIRDRPPVNFEAQRVVQEIISTAHRQAAWPVQRSGDPDASIVSGKGVVALAGTFNSELAWAQQDMERGLEDINRLCAAFDEVHCPGEKRIFGMEGIKAFMERYDPTVLFQGDYRNRVSYGDRTGLDEANRLTKLALIKNMGGMSVRTFLDKSGAVEDPLQEERDIAIENLTGLFYQVLLPQRIQAGDLGALKAFVDRIDTDQETVRSAVLATIKELTELAAPIPGAPGAGAPPDTIRMMRSLASGGIPGNAAGLPEPPRIGGALQRALPGPARRLVTEAAPGGTAA